MRVSPMGRCGCVCPQHQWARYANASCRTCYISTVLRGKQELCWAIVFYLRHVTRQNKKRVAYFLLTRQMSEIMAKTKTNFQTLTKKEKEIRKTEKQERLCSLYRNRNAGARNLGFICPKDWEYLKFMECMHRPVSVVSGRTVWERSFHNGSVCLSASKS